MLVDLNEWRIFENYADKILFCVRDGIYSNSVSLASMVMLVEKTPDLAVGEVEVMLGLGYGVIFDRSQKEGMDSP